MSSGQGDWVLRRKKLEEVTGLGHSTIYKLIKEGKFPKQVKLSDRSVGWKASSVFQWLAERTGG